MCRQVFRECRECGYRRVGWWDKCAAYWDQYAAAIDPLFPEDEERPAKPRETTCPWRETDLKDLSLGACDRAACPSKPKHQKKMAARERSRLILEEEEQLQIEAFVAANFKKAPMRGAKKAKGFIAVARSDEFEREQERNGRCPAKRQDTVAAHQEAREAILSMMRNQEAMGDPAVGSEGSEMSPPTPQAKRHVRGGYMMKREGARRGSVSNHPASNNTGESAGAIAIKPVNPTAAGTKEATPNGGAIPVGKPIALKAKKTTLSDASATSPEDEKSDDGKANSKSSDTDDCSADFGAVHLSLGTSYQQPSPLSMTPAELAVQKDTLVRPPPGLGFAHPQPKHVGVVPTGFEKVLDEPERKHSGMVRSPPGPESAAARSSGHVTPANFKDASFRQAGDAKKSLQTTAYPEELALFLPQLPETRPRYQALTARDQLRGFFGRLAPDTSETDRLDADFSMLFGDSSPLGLSQSRSEVVLTSSTMGRKLANVVEDAGPSKAAGTRAPPSQREKRGKTRVDLAHHPAHGETQGHVRLVAPPPGLGFKEARAIPAAKAGNALCETRCELNIGAPPLGVGLRELPRRTGVQTSRRRPHSAGHVRT